MAWSGGIFTRANGDTGWVDDAAALIGIEAGLHDTQDNDFKTGINATLTKDGTNTPTANLPMNTNRHTGVGAAVATTDYARFDQVISQTQNSTTTWGGTSGGTANAQTLTLSPPITAYAAGQRFGFVAGSTNTAAATLNVNGAGAINIITQSTGVSLPSNYLSIGAQYEVVYNGTAFVLLGDPALIKTGGYDFINQSTGTANALVLTSTGPKLASTAIYRTFIFATNLTNTGATTVAIDGLTAINVLNPDTSALRAGQLLGSRFYQLILINGVALLANPDQSWQTWTPVLSQGVAITSTIQEAAYKISNSTQITVAFRITATSAGTLGSPVTVALPISAAYSGSFQSIGSAVVYNATSGYAYVGMAALEGTANMRFATNYGTSAFFTGQGPSYALGIGSIVSATVTYRI